MTKNKLIGLLSGTISVLSITTATTVALTSCTSSNYNPDTSTKIIDVVPNKEIYNKLNDSYTTYINNLNKNHGPGWSTTGSFVVDSNKIIITQTEVRGSNTKPLDFILEFTFDNTNNVLLKSIAGQNHEVIQENKLTIENAKTRIYNECHYKP